MRSINYKYNNDNPTGLLLQAYPTCIGLLPYNNSLQCTCMHTKSCRGHQHRPMSIVRLLRQSGSFFGKLSKREALSSSRLDGPARIFETRCRANTHQSLLHVVTPTNVLFLQYILPSFFYKILYIVLSYQMYYCNCFSSIILSLFFLQLFHFRSSCIFSLLWHSMVIDTTKFACY